jgi:hypothetical protein
MKRCICHGIRRGDGRQQHAEGGAGAAGLDEHVAVVVMHDAVHHRQP